MKRLPVTFIVRPDLCGSLGGHMMTARLRRARRQISRGDVRVYGTDPEGWRHFPERTIIRLDALIEMQAELEVAVKAQYAPRRGRPPRLHSRLQTQVALRTRTEREPWPPGQCGRCCSNYGLITVNR
jgi:hypothetical protein